MLPSTFGPFEILNLPISYRHFCCWSTVSPPERLILRAVCTPDLDWIADRYCLTRIFYRFTPIRSDGRLLSRWLRPESAWPMHALRGMGVRLSKEQRERLSESFRASSFKNSVAFQFSVALSKQFLENDPEATVCLFVQTAADEELADHIVRSVLELGFGERIQLIKPISVQDYISHLAHVDYVVASRFHAVILSLLLTKPVFGVFFEAMATKSPDCSIFWAFLPNVSIYPLFLLPPRFRLPALDRSKRKPLAGCPGKGLRI